MKTCIQKHFSFGSIKGAVSSEMDIIASKLKSRLRRRCSGDDLSYGELHGELFSEVLASCSSGPEKRQYRFPTELGDRKRALDYAPDCHPAATRLT